MIAVILAVTFSDAESIEPVMVGAAKVDVTPKEPVVLAGYGSRTKEFEGIDNKLWARAMVIGETDPVAIVVLDNCGVPANITSQLASRLESHGIASERLVVAATHTHNAPNLVGYATVLWAGRTTAAMEQRMKAYTQLAVEKMEEAVLGALKAREPMQLEWAQGRVTFGGNRRILRDGKWAGFGFQRSGPVDHSLPVLAARDKQGIPRVVWANYACHCTTVGARNHVGGDWAGKANESMEKEFAHAVALTTIGCGADVGLSPRATWKSRRAMEPASQLKSNASLATKLPRSGSRRLRSRRSVCRSRIRSRANIGRHKPEMRPVSIENLREQCSKNSNPDRSHRRSSIGSAPGNSPMTWRWCFSPAKSSSTTRFD